MKTMLRKEKSILSCHMNLYNIFYTMKRKGYGITLCVYV